MTLVTLISLHIYGVVGGSQTVWLFITGVIAAFCLACLLSVVHEASHNTYFAGRAANGVAGTVASLVILMNFRLYQREHALHHKFFGTEFDTEEHIHIAKVSDLLKVLFWPHHALEHWTRSFRALFKPAKSPVAKRIRFYAWLLVGWIIALVALTTILPWIMLLAFWLPFALSLVFDALISLPEHATFGPIKPEEQPTRSLRYPLPVEFMLYWVNLHEEHHGNAKVTSPLQRQGGQS